MPAQRKRPSAAQRRQSQRQRGGRPAPAPQPEPVAKPVAPRRPATSATDRGRPARGGHARSGRFFAALGKSRWPTIIVAALIVAALVASGVVLYAQPGSGGATPSATVLGAPPSSTLVTTPSPSATR